MKDKLKILIVLVVYRKKIADIRFLKTFDFSCSNIHVYIHDNSPDSQYISAQNNITYYHDCHNSGVSHAYNRGFEIALKKGMDCILLLDQDTTFEFKCLIEYYSAYYEFGNKFIYAPCVCNVENDKQYSPAYMNRFVGHVLPFNKVYSAQLYQLNSRSVINSGLMIPTSIFEKIGGYNQDIKLDFSDVYFIEKYKENNNNLVLLPVELIHSLSGDEGYDKARELHRFKYYCIGARELTTSLEKNTLYTVIRRMVRLVVKYRTLNPLATVAKYYLSDGVL
ncbi:glycosyltransferase [Aeromonas media]